MDQQEKLRLRQQAQQLLKNQPDLAETETLSHQDLKHLVEEMQIYLAELEVQNQQLQETQLKLDHQEVQYKKLFEHLPIPALLLNQSGIIIENNEQAELFFAHRTTRHLRNHSIFRFLSDTNSQWLLNRLNDLHLTDVLSASFECQIQGESIPVKVSLMPIKQSLDQFAQRHFIVTFIDLTDQYLRQKEWRIFQGVLDHSSVLIYAFDRDGRCLLANQKFAEFFGFKSPGETMGLKREELMSLRDANAHFQHDLDVLTKKKPIQFKEDVFKNGQLYYLLTDKFPLLGSHNEVMAVGGITYDISEQTEQEKQLALSNEIFTKGQDGIIVCDPDGLILSVNHAFEEITGYAQQDCLKKNPRFLSSGRHDKSFYENFWYCLVKQGFWRGEIWNKRKSGEIYPQQLSVSSIKDTQGNLINYLGVFNDITDKKRAEEEVMHLAFYDPLTGVANRLLLRERTEQLIASAQRNPNSFSLMFIDLDHFKDVNDVHGHDVGDALLKDVTQRINALIRPQDTLARIGGDEFAVLFPRLTPQNSLELGERLVSTLAEPYIIKNQHLHISASIGIALFPDDAQDYKTLLKHADLAMYHAKHQGRNSVYLFKNELETELTRSVNIETELRYAIELNQFHLVFQPQYSIKHQSYLCMEALIRWSHPKMGIVSPNIFIPLAERSDFIMDITDWVLNNALMALDHLRKKGIHLNLSVNISARELIRSDFVERIRKHLAAFPEIAPEQLELEITERIAMEQPTKILLIFHSLRLLGVGLTLDDFGTGYSSLNYLKKYPLQTLKIDKSFVDDIGIDREDEAVCKAIISLAKAIGYQTVAEGVETQQQAEFLEQQGCDLIQGYYYSKPLTEEDLINLLSRNNESISIQ
ncbi:sensor domain-containing protein [Thiomicrospira microaerophila]|uniref:sensor domain-containing protein n=1 Tax=Thiomicrospira microaerophila TaxID=406020 RepID=UPI000696A283|nr:bifunctional diguanylate cyclase/phosphodiesterase [Thiomicrospira microaerophila]